MLVLAVSVLVDGAALAHTVGLSAGEYVVTGTALRIKASFARTDVAVLVPSLDGNHDGHLTALEVLEAKAAIVTKVKDRIEVSSDGGPCPSLLLDVALTELDGLVVDVKAECPAAATRFDVRLAVLDDLPEGHRHVARAISGAATHDEVLARDHAAFSIARLDAPGRPRAADERTARPTPASPGFFRMGVAHILTGWDHLVFLFAIVLLPARVRQLAWVVTAFTVAHSLTLALAVLGVLAPAARIVEPAIGLSIAYVGVENFFLRDGGKRWRVTFPFGLVHGFGFASALSELSLDRARIPSALVAFNVGVEVGQLAVMSAFVVLVAFARRRLPRFDPVGVRVLSGIVVGVGVTLAIARIIAP